jgi:hypothetical protein
MRLAQPSGRMSVPLWPRPVAGYPTCDGYRKRISGQIPVIILSSA